MQEMQPFNFFTVKCHFEYVLYDQTCIINIYLNKDK